VFNFFRDKLINFKLEIDKKNTVSQIKFLLGFYLNIIKLKFYL